ncbi:leucine zipper domain-containing protein [Subtercola sp. Z020]|uniref:leucine zipper domain-containing protein n=1 Tax=Subtercola sp. Z020 TaxID=2080582 RepID=UPI0018EC1EE7
MTHANAPLTSEGRCQLADLIVNRGWGVRRAAERFPCSPSTASKWASRYRPGLPLTDRPSKPLSSPRHQEAQPHSCWRWTPHPQTAEGFTQHQARWSRIRHRNQRCRPSLARSQPTGEQHLARRLSGGGRAGGLSRRRDRRW